MSKLRWASLAVFLILSLGLILIVVTPTWRDHVRAMLIPHSREVLASAEGDLLNNGTPIKVIKFKSGEALYVEILKADPQGGPMIVVDRILLPDRHDGLFNFHGHVTRLAIADIDNDGTLELLAPSFDNQLVPHLNAYKYNAATQRFEPFQK